MKVVFVKLDKHAKLDTIHWAIKQVDDKDKSAMLSRKKKNNRFGIKNRSLK